ncbi:FKBP-type peptidyl-prolyl cis-trans isomerase [Sphingobacterium pedocola]|uniref:Peptidyl-prolyl cis-trans isomerase n=1 Tax=Sphingobacterium pedocola TaxID=2082722 RepID=A0ABR9TAI1_9SPHI|nr:FKBP-type peptidyl-prolyl cis-trans isomerase [Sphingobacterium pedocola]MBE8722275.1 peptidylprolyl isomerase [Sphingobacterium pedocola]
MKNLFKLLFAVTITAATFASCVDDKDIFDPEAQLALEKPMIESYVKQHYPNAQQYENSGLWYEIIEPGEPDSYDYDIKDTLNQKWIFAEGIINYKGKLVADGTVFDETKDITKGDTLPIYMSLNTGNASVITAWIYAFSPKDLTVDDKDLDLGIIFTNGAQNGARFRIITPSQYAYGRSVQGKIPANSPLDFEVEVLKMRDFDPKRNN